MSVREEQSQPAPVEGGSSEEFETERASATPKGGEGCDGCDHRATKPRRKSRLPALNPPLETTQHWFIEAITHPGTIESGMRKAQKIVGRGRVVTDGPILDAVDRMRIYHYAYRARLVECLADDYPTIQYAMGADRFERLASDVIDALPSRKANLNGYGRVVIDYLQRGPGEDGGRVPNRRFYADLARLEWALVEAVHAAPVPALDLPALQAIPIEQWGDVRFTPSASLRILRFDYPVNRFLQHFREDKVPSIPRAKTTATAVYRQGFAVWRMDLDLNMVDLLDALLRGETLGAALAPLEDRLDASHVMAWFMAWVRSGFFATVR